MKRMFVGLTLALAACGSGESTTPETETPAADPAAALLARHEGATGPFAPRDDCSGIAGADEFRLALANAVLARDAEALLALADPAIRLDFGGGAGHDLLRARLDDPDYLLWEQLEAILPLGCAAAPEGSMLTLPWYFAQDLGGRDPFETLMVAGAEVPLRAAPQADAEVLERLSWSAVLQVADAPETEGYMLVRAPDGTTEGYVASGALRFALDYRALANRVDGSWKLTALIAGD